MTAFCCLFLLIPVYNYHQLSLTVFYRNPDRLELLVRGYQTAHPEYLRECTQNLPLVHKQRLEPLPKVIQKKAPEKVLFSLHQ